MLYSIEREKYVKELPHRNDFKVWRSRLSDADYERVVEAIGAAIGDDEVSTAGWIPGRDWTGTPYEPLYYACGRDTEQAGRFFGLIVFKLLMEREDRAWSFGRYEKNGVPITSMTYFVVPMDKLPPR